MFKKEKKNLVKENNKPQRLKKTIALKIARIIVWTIFIFIFVRGTINLIRPDPIKQMEKNQQMFLETMSSESSIQTKAFAFGEEFAKEYFTHIKGEDGEYKKRLFKYVSSYVLDTVKSISNTSVISAKSYDIESYSDNQYDVYVSVKVEYKNDEQQITDTKEIYLKVPIKYTNNFVVEDIPNVVSSPSRGAVDSAEFDGTLVDTNTSSEITAMIKQFLKAYYELPQTQIDYFIDSESTKANIRGLDGTFLFSDITKCEAYGLDDSNFLVVLECEIKDVDGSILLQRYNIKLIKRDNKYYVSQMNTRSVNIKED